MTPPIFAADRRAAVDMDRKAAMPAADMPGNNRLILPARRAHSSKPSACCCSKQMGQTYRQTDSIPLHRPCSRYFAGSATDKESVSFVDSPTPQQNDWQIEHWLANTAANIDRVLHTQTEHYIRWLLWGLCSECVQEGRGNSVSRYLPSSTWLRPAVCMTHLLLPMTDLTYDIHSGISRCNHSSHPVLHDNNNDNKTTTITTPV